MMTRPTTHTRGDVKRAVVERRNLEEDVDVVVNIIFSYFLIIIYKWPTEKKS